MNPINSLGYFNSIKTIKEKLYGLAKWEELRFYYG